MINSDFKKGFNILIAFITNMLLPYCILIVSTKRKNILQKAFTFWVILGVIDSILTIAQVHYGAEFYLAKYFFPKYLFKFYAQTTESGVFSGLGFFFNRAHNALFLLTPFIFILTKVMTKKWRFGLSAPLLILISVAIISTYSRMVVFLTFLGTGLLVVFSYYNFKDKLRHFFVYLLSIITIVVTFYISYSYSKYPRYAVENISARYEIVDLDYQTRRSFWSQSIELLKKPSDFLIGIGLGATGNFADRVEVHNAYIELMVEIGIIGLVMWLIFLYGTIRKSIKILKVASKEKQFIEVSLVSTITMISIMIYFFIGGSIREGHLLFTLPFALVQSFYILQQKQKIPAKIFKEVDDLNCKKL